METLRVGFGVSEEDDAFAAGTAAATSAVAGLGSEAPELVIVYAPARYDLGALLRGVRTVTGRASVLGGSSRGQFHNGQVPPIDSSVSVLALTGGDYQFGTASVTEVSLDPSAAGHRLARAAQAAAAAAADSAAAHRRARATPYAALLLLTSDLRTSDPQALLSGVYRVTGAAVPLVGGVTSDDGQGTGTCVFHDDAVLTDAAVAVWIRSPRPLTVECAHGWRAEGLPMMVTRVNGHEVSEIAGRPAAEVLTTHVQNAALATCEPPEVGEVAAPRNVAYAIGLVEPDGNQVLRGAFLGSDGVLRTWAPLPAYAAIRIVSYVADELLDATERLVTTALAGGSARVLLTFCCAAHMEILDDRRHEEAKRMQQAAGDVTTFGFYTYGEFARTTSVAGYHNVAITALAL